MTHFSKNLNKGGEEEEGRTGGAGKKQTGGAGQ
jgi:hypothetical protein